MKDAKLKNEIKSLIIKENGKTKDEAIGNCFAAFRKNVTSQIEGFIVKMEPLEVYLLEEKKNVKTEKFLELFMPREKITYDITLEIEYEIKYVKI